VHKQKRIGFTLIVIGVFTPLLLLLVATGYNRNANVIVNILTVRIVVWDPVGQKTRKSNSVGAKATAGRVLDDHQGRIAIPYRFPLAFCIFLIFLGIRQLDQSRKNTSYNS
jgi:hypothetical protein